jgi:hypothetical protein
VWEKTLKLLKKSHKKDVAALRATFDLTFCQKVTRAMASNLTKTHGMGRFIRYYTFGRLRLKTGT